MTNNTNGLLNPQDINVKSCTLITSGGIPIDFTDIVVQFSYFEDLFNNGVTGSLLISDSMGFINNLQMHGQEYIIVELDKPGYENPIQRSFRVRNISDRVSTRGTNEHYKINFCSEEWMLNEQYLISKSYNKVMVSDVVKDIALNYLKIDSKKLYVHETLGMRDIVIPNLKPFQIMNWLATFAIAKGDKNIGAPFFFYENRNGFHFKSILNLFKQTVYKSYRYDEKNLKLTGGYTDIDKEINNIIAFEHIQNFDNLSAIKNGMFANETVTVDPLRLKFGSAKFDYEQYTKFSKKLGEYNLPTSGKNRFGEKINEVAGSIKFVVSTTGQSENVYFKEKNLTVNENRIEETLSNRTAQFMLLTANRMKLMIPGDFQLTVGMIIDIKLPELVYNNKAKTRELDQFYSGKYLVTALRHLYSRDNKFVTVLEICKDSVNTKYAQTDDTNPAWKGIK